MMLNQDKNVADGGVTLDRIKKGKKAKIIGVRAGMSGSNRLLSMGVGPGVEVQTVSVHPFQGPVVIKVDNTQVALGRGLARRILVEEL